LEVAAAWVCTPAPHGDDRGVFLEWFRADAVQAVTGRTFTPVQANHSSSRSGVLRGIHYADVPPGQAKYVYCSRGAVLDVIVDLRLGSPTFGRHVTVTLDDADRRAVLLSEGLGHGFCALSDVADVTYLVSTPYNPAAERTIDPHDAELALPWPGERATHQLSPKDAAAPGLAEARDRGTLPAYQACLDHYADVAARATT
jgi:dTDP-4-dehydrorhamnose 3,5-epimerase